MVLDFETDQSNGFSHLFAQIFQHSQSDICIDNLIKCELSPEREKLCPKILLVFLKNYLALAPFLVKTN